MCEMRIHGYARVSSKDQNAERQIAALKEFGVHDRDIYKKLHKLVGMKLNC